MVTEKLNEDLLEQLYWQFDDERKRGNRSERDIFKGKMRFFATNGHVVVEDSIENSHD